MKTKEFEQEIKVLDDGFSIIENANRPGLSNIFFRGRNYDLPVVSAYEIKDFPDASHKYQFPGGMTARLWSKSEIVPRLEQFLKDYKDGKFDGIYD